MQEDEFFFPSNICTRTYLSANTGAGIASFKDNDGDTTTVLKVGKKENSKSTVALSERKKQQKTLLKTFSAKYNGNFSLKAFPKVVLLTLFFLV